MKKIILLIGMPGSGKGSIGKLCEERGYVHISSSKLLKIEQELDIAKAIYLKIPKGIALQRVLERIVCPKCGEIYTTNAHKSPKNSGICDICGSSLERRGGDTKDIFKKRLCHFFNNSYPIINYYRMHKSLIIVDATKNGEEIFETIKTL